MNTKTTFKCGYSYYDGSNNGVGGDSPGALLDMLAEVASQTLHSEKKHNASAVTAKSKSKGDSVKRKTQESSFNVSELLSMPATQLVKLFSIFTSDELKRQYSYTCALVPECGQRYTSFASEGRARMSIKAHLADHLECLKRDKEACSSFTTTAVKLRNSKTNLQSKRGKPQQPKKPQETLNKENKDVKSEKSTNYLRKILSNEMSFKEFERHKAYGKISKSKDTHMLEEKKETDEVNFKVLGDHSYYEHMEDKTSNVKTTPDLGGMIMNEVIEDNIMLMVVENDTVHMKEVPYIAHKMTEHFNQEESKTIYLPETVTWSEEGYAEHIETAAPAKPKGKAKFIGTSKEEREMALALMDRIKKKGNPTGGNLQCRICDPPRSFTAPTTLVSHYRSHAGIKPYECRICRAVFTRRHSLKYHMLIHQNQTRFTCADCGKKFRHPSHFREHRRRHTGEAPFGCEDCGQRFKTRNTYKRHLKTRHGKILTTTGELLRLSDEDFQKVRTNRKRRLENIIPENMADEDITAPKAIIQYENSDSNDNVERHIGEDVAESYKVHSDKNDVNGNSGVWTTGGMLRIFKKGTYSNYEINDESHENKTDCIETEIEVENSDFESEEMKANQSRYDKTQIKCHEKMQEELMEAQVAVSDNLHIVKNVRDEVVYHRDLEDRQNDILYHNDQQIIEFNNAEYHDSLETVEEEQEVLEYQENIHLPSNRINDKMEVLLKYNELDYCDDDLNKQGKECYKSVQSSESQQEEGPAEINTECESEMQEDRIQQYEIQITPEEESVQCQESQTNVKYENDVLILKDKRVQVVRCKTGTLMKCEDSLRNSDISHGIRFIQRNEPTLQRKYTLRKQDRKGSVEEEQFQSMTNQTAEKMVNRLASTACENQSIQPSSNIRHLYVHTDQSNNAVIREKDVVNVLPYQLKFHQQQSQPKLQLPQNREITIDQNGKRNAILVLTNNDSKHNFLCIDQNSIVINGTKTLPIVTVPQK